MPASDAEVQALQRMDELGSLWLEAFTIGNRERTYRLDCELDAARRDFRKHERKRRKAEKKAGHA